MKHILFSCIVAIQAASFSLANAIDVGGPSPDALTIAAAIEQATSGDVVRVCPGQYTSFTIDGKSISVVGEGGADVQMARGMLYLGTVGPTGAVQTPIGPRDTTLLTHTRLHTMAVSLSPHGRRFGNPVTPLLLDAAW